MDTNVVFLPLEDRTVEIIGKNGIKQKVPAFNKNFVPDLPFQSFYLPPLESLAGQPAVLHEWEEQMGVYVDNLKFLLRLPHYKFWSSLVFSKAISDHALSSYLIHAPRPHDPETKKYLDHPRIGPLILQIHGFIFRIFLRLSTIKESKEDHISPSKWAMLVFGREFFATSKLLHLSLLFGSSHKKFLMEMVKNVLENQSRLFEGVCGILPVYVTNWRKQSKELTGLVRQMSNNRQDHSRWEIGAFQDILRVNLENVVSFHKFVQIYPPIATFAHGTPQFELTLALSYEQDVQQWKKVVANLPELESHVNIWRVHMLKLFRLVLSTSTILANNNPDGGAVDEFFGALSNCLELCLFLHDYERTFPFMTDINQLRRKGVHVDSTRVEYLSNAFEASFEACGQRYSSNDTRGSNDLLDDPTFDRQLLGACSLDVVGPELQSLVTQVKDLLPDLQDAYIEACLKHYGYQSETVINAILEGSVPSNLEKYKDVVIPPPPKVEKAEQGHLYRKNETTVDDSFLLPSAEMKQRVLECYDAQETRKLAMADEPGNGYVPAYLLPNFREDAEYDDEYDDTYDEVGVGLTEPDAMPLNPKLKPRYQVGESDDDEEPETMKSGGFEQFVEDPAIVRARMEQRRATQYRGNNNSSPPRDVVGRVKGQGQSTEVLLNRRRKDEVGSHNRRKRADHKRREF